MLFLGAAFQAQLHWKALVTRRATPWTGTLGRPPRDTASHFPAGQTDLWNCTSQYNGESCLMGAQAGMTGMEEWDGCYNSAFGNCAYGESTCGSYGGYIESYDIYSGCGASPGYGLENAYILNMDQYSDASDSEDEVQRKGKSAVDAKCASVVEVASTALSKERSVSESSEVAEPAPEPTHGGCILQASAQEFSPADSLVEAELSSGCSEPEAEVSGQEQDTHQLHFKAPQVATAVPWSGKASHRSESTCCRPTLQVSEGSWAAQQRAHRGAVAAGGTAGDAEVVRKMKSILNKLTIEKFPVLYQNLLQCGIQTAGHAEALIREVFEKATTQHHFVDMYADLCALLQEHFENNPLSDDSKFSFRRLLLNECQASFERNLAPPSELELVEPEERTLLEFRYKTRMLGNIRFVGALLIRKMLACKVLFTIIEELLSNTTPETLESLAVLLTVVGPTFDNPEWAYYKPLAASFQQLKAISEKASCSPRAKCLLKDLLDLRARSWQDTRKRSEGPTTLEGVARQAAAEERAATAEAAARSARAATRVTPSATPSLRVKRLQELCWQPVSPQQSKRYVAKSPNAASSPLSDVAKLRADVRKAYFELSTSGALAPEADSKARQLGFQAVAKLFLDGQWQRDTLEQGLWFMLEEARRDVRVDERVVRRILQELAPAMAPTQQKILELQLKEEL